MKINESFKSKNRILKTEYDYEQWLFNNKLITINNEEVKSYSELKLANYLFLQGISYEYEAQHEKEEIYNPDFKLINENIYIYFVHLCPFNLMIVTKYCLHEHCFDMLPLFFFVCCFCRNFNVQ